MAPNGAEISRRTRILGLIADPVVQMDLIVRFIVGLSGVAWDEPVRSGR